MKNLLEITNDDGRRFTVRVVVKGERYGRTDGLLHRKHDPMVEFYDASHAGPKFGPLGQFVQRYYLSTLLKRAGSALCLHGGVPVWHVSAANVADAIRHATDSLDIPASVVPFDEFRSSRRWVDDLDPPHKACGLVYLMPGWMDSGNDLEQMAECLPSIELTDDWPEDAPGCGKGRWYVRVGEREYQSDDLRSCERKLYEFAREWGGLLEVEGSIEGSSDTDDDADWQKFLATGKFSDFKLSRRWDNDLRSSFPEHVHGQDYSPLAEGLVYGAVGDAPGYVIERTTHWPKSSPGYGQGRWYLQLANQEYQSDDLVVLERELFEFCSDQTPRRSPPPPLPPLDLLLNAAGASLSAMRDLTYGAKDKGRASLLEEFAFFAGRRSRLIDARPSSIVYTPAELLEDFAEVIDDLENAMVHFNQDSETDF